MAKKNWEAMLKEATERSAEADRDWGRDPGSSRRVPEQKTFIMPNYTQSAAAVQTVVVPAPVHIPHENWGTW